MGWFSSVVQELPICLRPKPWVYNMNGYIPSLSPQFSRNLEDITDVHDLATHYISMLEIKNKQYLLSP